MTEVDFINYLYEFAEYKRKTKVDSPVTYKNYLTNVRRMQEYLKRVGKKGILLKDVKARLLLDFYMSLREKGLKQDTLKRISCIFSGAFEKAYTIDEYITENPHYKLIKSEANPLAPDKNQRKESVCLNKDEMTALFKFGEKHPMIKIFKLFYLFGGRRSEILGLIWDNIDFVNKTVLIAGNLQKHDRQYIRSDNNKTAGSKDIYPMTPEIEMLLLSIKKDIEDNKKAFGSAYGDKFSKYICVDPLGKVYAPDTVSSNFKRLAESCGISGMTLHGLRHSAGTILYDETKDIVKVQLFLRHGSTNTTNRYIHPKNDTKLQSVNCLAAVVDLGLYAY